MISDISLLFTHQSNKKVFANNYCQNKVSYASKQSNLFNSAKVLMPFFHFLGPFLSYFIFVIVFE